MRRPWKAWLWGLGWCACWPGPQVGEPVESSPETETRQDSGSDGGSEEGVRFSQLQEKVFTPTCAASFCHRGSPPPVAPMSLEADTAYGSLVNHSSVQVPGLMRVAPGDPEHSY